MSNPEFAQDPRLENFHIVTLSYTFYQTKEGIKLPQITHKNKQLF